MDLFTQPEAHARRTDPETSHIAAEQVSPKVGLVRAQVLAFAAERGEGGFCDVDLAEHFGTHASTYRSRRAELVAAGLVEDSGSWVLIGGKGRRHILWRVTAKGMGAHADASRLAA